MKIRTRQLRLPVLLIVITVLFGCAVNPVTGQKQLMLVSEQDEVSMGAQTDKSVVEQYGLYEDQRLHDYIQGIGLRMARLSHRPNLNWSFKVMDSPVVNAFAAPGGYIYVTRGLLAALNNEAELAGVLGHEIGHVTARHSAQQYSQAMLANIGVSLGKGILGSYGAGGDMLGSILEQGTGLLFLKFSRDDERESDALGVDYASRAGYDAGRTADFFTTLHRQSSLPDQRGGRLPEFLSSHPSPVNREANVRAMAKVWQANSKLRNFAVNREAYLDEIDGLVYGEDPRKGFQEDGWYYLPLYKVKLPVPVGWKLDREGNNFQMLHPEKKAVALVSIRDDSQAGQIARDFIDSTGVKVQDSRSATVNGMPLQLMLSTLGSGKQRAVVISHFYQKESDVFAFHAITGEADYATLKDVMQGPATGFDVMTDRSKLGRQPKQVVVTAVNRSSTLEGLLGTMNIDLDLWPRIAWLNSKQLTDTLALGERVKVIR